MTSDKREKAIKYLTEEIRSLRMAPQINGCGPENWADQLEIMETCLQAVRWHSNQPLTLDQLREMDGQPVWIKRIGSDSPEDKEWALVFCKEKFCRTSCGNIALFGCYGIGWLAYAYPPAHIDREAWISVEDRLPDKQKDVLMLFDTGNMAVGFWHDADEHITFWCAYTDDGFYTDCDCMPTYWMPLPEPPAELEKRVRGEK